MLCGSAILDEQTNHLDIESIEALRKPWSSLKARFSSPMTDILSTKLSKVITVEDHALISYEIMMITKMLQRKTLQDLPQPSTNNPKDNKTVNLI